MRKPSFYLNEQSQKKISKDKKYIFSFSSFLAFKKPKEDIPLAQALKKFTKNV